VTPVEKADVLLEALPYIRRFAGKLLVIKYGGHAMEDDELKDSFAQDVTLLKYVGMNPVIVHGGGHRSTPRSSRRASSALRARAARDHAATMSVVEMVLVGKINKEIVTLLNRHAATPSAVSGKTGSWSSPASGEHRTWDSWRGVGVNARVVDSLAGFIPVIAPVAADADGSPTASVCGRCGGGRSILRWSRWSATLIERCGGRAVDTSC